MKPLKIYRISDHYIRFLKSCDSRVQDNKNRRRPYVGVVLLVGEHHYFVPMESPKSNHANISPGIHIMRIDNGKLGLLGFNNMIPVPNSALISFDINDEPDANYADLLRRQASWINRNKADILDHASKTYYAVVRGGNKFLSETCCDFKTLERASKRYNPSYTRSNK